MIWSHEFSKEKHFLNDSFLDAKMGLYARIFLKKHLEDQSVMHEEV